MLADINVDLFYFFNHAFENSFFNAVMPVITKCGGFSCLASVLVIIIIYAHLRKNKFIKRIAIMTLCALLFSDLIAFCLKHLINEPRPFISLDNVHLLITEDDPYSFPSGHATSTLAVVTFMILNMKEWAQKHYKIIDAVLIVFAIAIVFSRMYVGVHYPADVLAGIIIGIFGAFTVNRFKDEIMELFGKIF